MRALALLLCIVSLHSLPLTLFSQCNAAPPLEACTGSEVKVVNNDLLLTGAKRWHYGAAATINQLTMRGGTLIVCSELTINVLTMDSGTIVIRPGAKLTAGGGGSGMIWRGNCAVYNHGRFEITSNLSFEGPNATATKPNLLMNVTPASSSRAFNYFTINNPYSFFVNNGKAEFHGIITDPNSSPGCVCLGTKSQTHMSVLINKVKDTYVAPYQYACVSVSSYSQFTDTLTNDPTLLACISSSHSSASGGTNRPNAWGAANRFSNCSTCDALALLPTQPGQRPPTRGTNDAGEEVTVYPNPFQDVLQIQWVNGKKPLAVDIYDQTGRILYHRMPDKDLRSPWKLPLSNLPAGTHIARIQYPGSVSIHKIVKKTP